MAAIEQALIQLGKELTCSICLSIIHQPCARLPCCHYFCRGCIQQSLRVKATCPICKSAAHRRDVFQDDKLDRIISLYCELEVAFGQQLLCSQLPQTAAGLAAASASLHTQKQPQQHQQHMAKQHQQQPEDAVSPAPKQECRTAATALLARTGSGSCMASHQRNCPDSGAVRSPGASHSGDSCGRQKSASRGEKQHRQQHEQQHQLVKGGARGSPCSSVPSWIKAHHAQQHDVDHSGAVADADTAEDQAESSVVAAASGAGSERRVSQGHRTRRSAQADTVSDLANRQDHIAVPGGQQQQESAGATTCQQLQQPEQQQRIRHRPIMGPPGDRPSKSNVRPTKEGKAAATNTEGAAAEVSAAAGGIAGPKRQPNTAQGIAAADPVTGAAEEGVEQPRYAKWLRGLNLDELQDDLQPLSSTSTAMHGNGRRSSIGVSFAGLQPQQEDQQEQQEGDQAAAMAELQLPQQQSAVLTPTSKGCVVAGSSGKSGSLKRKAVAEAVAVPAMPEGSAEDNAASKRSNTRSSSAAAAATESKQLSMLHFMRQAGQAGAVSSAGGSGKSRRAKQRAQHQEQQQQEQLIGCHESPGTLPLDCPEVFADDAVQSTAQQQHDPAATEDRQKSHPVLQDKQHGRSIQHAIHNNSIATAIVGNTTPGKIKDQFNAVADTSVPTLGDSTTAGTTPAAADEANAATAATDPTAEGNRRSSGRRIPSRLLPWTCSTCTLENKGADSKCSVCGTPKGSATAAGQVAAEQAQLLQRSTARTSTAGATAAATAANMDAAIGSTTDGSRAAEFPAVVVTAAADAADEAPGSGVAGAGSGTGRKSSRRSGRRSSITATRPPPSNCGKGSEEPQTHNISQPAALEAEQRLANVADIAATPAAQGGPSHHCCTGSKQGSRSMAKPTSKRRSAGVVPTFVAPAAAAAGVANGTATAGADGSAAATVEERKADHNAEVTAGAKRRRSGSTQWDGDVVAAGSAVVGSSHRSDSAKRPAAGSSVMVGSGLTDEEKLAMEQLGSMCGGHVVDTWTPCVTHVVCHTDENLQARRTLKYMQGMLAGCWVVSSSWVTACLAAAANAAAGSGTAPLLVSEGPYEVSGDGSGANGGPARGRQRKEQQLPALLHGVQVFIAGSGSLRDNCVSLVKAAGGSVISRLPPATAAIVAAAMPSAMGSGQLADSQGNGKHNDAVVKVTSGELNATVAAAGEVNLVASQAAVGKAMVLVPGTAVSNSSDKRRTAAAAVGSHSQHESGQGVSRAAIKQARQLGLLVLQSKWLTDSVSSMQLMSTEEYVYVA